MYKHGVHQVYRTVEWWVKLWKHVHRMVVARSETVPSLFLYSSAACLCRMHARSSNTADSPNFVHKQWASTELFVRMLLLHQHCIVVYEYVMDSIRLIMFAGFSPEVSLSITFRPSFLSRSFLRSLPIGWSAKCFSLHLLCFGWLYLDLTKVRILN